MLPVQCGFSAYDNDDELTFLNAGRRKIPQLFFIPAGFHWERLPEAMGLRLEAGGSLANDDDDDDEAVAASTKWGKSFNQASH